MVAKLKKPPDGQDRRYTASDLKDKAGVSYRQLNTWEAKGVLPSGERDGRQWRKFTGREFFVIMVCAELRRRFRATSEELRWIQDFMLQEGANHYRAAVDMMDKCGLSVFILTDFETTFVMTNELDFADYWDSGYFGSDEPEAYVLLKVNPLVNDLLGTLQEPIRLENHGRLRSRYLEGESMVRAQLPQEIHLLELVRNPDYRKIEISLKDGRIKQFWVDEELEVGATSIEDVLASEEFQTVEILQKHGKPVRTTRRIPIKPTGADLDLDPKRTPLIVHRVDLDPMSEK